MDQHMNFLNVDQEVEAKFNTPGFRGAWFLCRILEIKDGRGEPNCLLKYLNFEDAPTWHKARQPDPAAKPKYWMKGKKTLQWMIRPPAPAVIPECDLEDFKKRVALKEKKDVTVVALFDNEYMVGDMVEWWKDDAWWTGRITELSTTDKGAQVVTLALLSFPHGEGLTCRGVKTSKLRPAFSWSRQNQWSLLPPKICARRAIGEKPEKPEKPRVQIIYLAGDSSSLSNPQQCGLKDLGSVHSSHPSQSTNMQSECNGHLASVHSECISEKRHSSSDLTDLVATSSTPYSSNGSGAHEVGKSDCSTSAERRRHRLTSLSKAKQDTRKEKGRRNILNTTSFCVSDSDTDELEQSVAEPKPQQCSAKMRIAIAEDTKVHVSVPGHDGEDKNSGADTKGPIPTSDMSPPTVETSSEKLLNSSSLAEMSLPHGNLTKTQVLSCKESSNMEELLAHEHLGNRSVEVYLPTKHVLEDAEEPQLSLKESLLGDKNSQQMLAEDVSREVGETGHKLEMALDSKREAKRKVATTDQPTARQISGSPGCSQGGSTSCSGRADAEICEMATTSVNLEATNKVDDIIGENITSNFSTCTQSSRSTQPSQVLEPSITVQPTKQKQRATKLQENEFRLKTVKKAKDVFQFWRKRKFAGSEAVPVVKRLRTGGLNASSKIPAINCDGNERAEFTQDVVLSSAPSTPVCVENRDLHSVCHTEWDVPMEEENNECLVTEEAKLVDTLEIKSGECEVSVAPVHSRATALEGDKGPVTLSLLQECSEKATHALVDNISTTECSCKNPAAEKSDICPAEETQVNDVDLEAELDALERLTERIDGLKWRVTAMKKRGKRKRAAKLSVGLDGNKKDSRDEPPMVCGEPPVKKMCVGRMAIPTERPLDLKDRKTSLADSTGSMEKCGDAFTEIPCMRGALNMKDHSQIVTKDTGRNRRRKNSTPTKIPVHLKAELPEEPLVQLRGYTGREGRKGINLSGGPVAFEPQKLEQRVPMEHQKKKLGGQRSRRETPSNVDTSSVSKQEETALNSKTVDKLKIKETQSVEHMRLSPLSRETPERPFLAADSIPQATQAGSDDLVMNPGVNSVAAQAVKMGKVITPREGISGAGTTSSTLRNVNRGETESQLQVFDNQKGSSESVCGGIQDRQQPQIQCNIVIQGNVLPTTSCKGATDKGTANTSGSEDLSARMQRSNVTVVDQRTLESPITIPITLAGQQPPLGSAGEVITAVKDTDSTKCNQKKPLVSIEVHERSCASMPMKVISGAEIILSENNGKKVKWENDLGTASLRCNEVLVHSRIENPQSMCQQSECTGVLEGLEKLKDEFKSASQRPFKSIQEQSAVAEVVITLWQSIHQGVQDPPSALQCQTMLKRLKVISEMLKSTDYDPVGSTFNVVLRAFNSEDLYIGLYKTEPEAIAVCSMISRCQKVIREFISAYKKSSTPTMELVLTSNSGEKQPSIGQRLGHPVPCTSNALSKNRVQNSIPSASDACVQSRSEVLNMQAPKLVETVTTSQIADQPWRQNYPGVHTVSHSALQPSGAGNICPSVQVSTGVPISEQLPARNQIQDVSGRFGGFTKQAPVSLLQANNHTQPPQNQEHPVHISSRDVLRRPLATPTNIIVLDYDDDNEDTCMSRAGDICTAVHVSIGVPISEQLPVSNQVQNVSGRSGGFTKQAPASLLQANNHEQPPPNQEHPVNISLRDVVRRPLAMLNNIIELDDDDDNEDPCRIMPPGAPIVLNSGSRNSRGHTLGQAGSVRSAAFPEVHFGGPPGCRDRLQCCPQPAGVTGLTREIPVNRNTREVGRGSMSVPTNITGGQAINIRRLYNCCMGTEATKLDYVLIRALHCDLCDWLMHTECAITQRKLALKRFYFNGEEHEQIIYICNCNKAWAVLPSLLSRIKYFLDLISRKQKSANNQAGGNPAAVRVVELIYIRELLLKMQQMLQPTRSPVLRCIHVMVAQMLTNICTNPNAVNFQVFVDNIDNAVNLIKGMWISPSRTMLPTARAQ